LREAQVEVTENKARPGSYNAVFHLRPHFQLEELTMSLRLVSELPKKK
jgi:type VI secretion system protein ImpC